MNDGLFNIFTNMEESYLHKNKEEITKGKCLKTKQEGGNRFSPDTAIQKLDS